MATNRRFFIGGSDARIIMGADEAALIRLWKEKRGELEPEDLSGDLLVQLGAVTEELNRQWYERTPDKLLPRCSGSYFTPSTGGWQQLWTGAWRQRGPCSRPSSCCHGIFRKNRRLKSIWRSFSTMRG